MANRLKEIRIQKELTQAELADMLKITVPYLNSIENGKRIPSLRLALRIAAALEKRIEDIFLD
ncbi:helix-turn-helix transcriptional regulator [Peribacillus sp. SCS-26]|uniref:helix-turn-helix transcriptional regulator n=1 Tax=Paraperibacillus marinus TaxID=3115295 RepID=UPI00390628C9